MTAGAVSSAGTSASAADATPRPVAAVPPAVPALPRAVLVRFPERLWAAPEEPAAAGGEKGGKGHAAWHMSLFIRASRLANTKTAEGPGLSTAASMRRGKRLRGTAGTQDREWRVCACPRHVADPQRAHPCTTRQASPQGMARHGTNSVALHGTAWHSVAARTTGTAWHGTALLPGTARKARRCPPPPDQGSSLAFHLSDAIGPTGHEACEPAGPGSRLEWVCSRLPAVGLELQMGITAACSDPIVSSSELSGGIPGWGRPAAALNTYVPSFRHMQPPLPPCNMHPPFLPTTCNPASSPQHATFLPPREIQIRFFPSSP
eukprot:170914-Chlamydomonas_euryale.AAC.4